LSDNSDIAVGTGRGEAGRAERSGAVGRAHAPGTEQETGRLGWFRGRGYFAKFVISFLGLVILVLVVNGALETWFVYRDTTQLVQQSLSEKAEAVARRVEQFLSETERQISWATRASATTLEQRHADYNALLQQVPAIDRAIFLDSTGRERLRVTRQDFVVESGLDYSGDPRFKEGRGESTWWSPVYFNGREPFIAIAAAHSGRSAGLTVAEVNLKFLSDFVDRSQTGVDTSAYIVDRAGRLLAQTGLDQGPGSDLSVRLRAAQRLRDHAPEGLGSDLSRLPQVAAALDAGAKPVMNGKDPEGRSVLSATAAIPRLHSHVFFEQQLSNVLRPVYGLIYRTAGLLALGMGLAILAGMLLARNLVAPIKTLQAGARQLESDFSHRIDVTTGDEIEELARQFNRMARQIQESYGRLEQKVAERTRDLAKSNIELKALEEIGRAVASSLDMKAVMATILARAIAVSHAEAGAIYRYDPSRSTIDLAEGSGLKEPVLDAARTAPIRVGASGLGMSRKSRDVVLVPDLSERPTFPHQALMLAAGFRSALFVPLVGQDELLGALVLFRRQAGDFPALDFMQTFADQSVLALNNARLFHEVEQKGHELSVASEHKSQFLANMSHELRTPLNAVLGYAELLADGLYGDMPDKAVEVLERIQSNGKQLLGLINDVLDISKIEAGQLTLSLDDYSVENMVQAVVTATESLARPKGIDLKTDIPAQLPMGRGDERRLTQVLTNLVSNAIKFTDTGYVEVGVRAADDAFRIAVKDTGPGIAEKDQAKIFEEFQQVDNSSTRNKGGTGLGLSISRRLVRMHGGRIDLHSTLGVGSTFTIIVPVRVEQQDRAA
jgi:signal transduction histidine kinase